MDKNILEFLNLIFRHIKNGACLILKHSHTLNAVRDILGKEFSQNPPHEGDGLESLLKFELDCNEVFLTSEERPRSQSLFVVARHVGKGNAESLSDISFALFDECVSCILKDAHNLGVYLVEILNCVS